MTKKPQMEKTMSAHTPGPWFVTGKGLSRYVEGNLRPGLVQEVAWCGATEVPEQMEANARLISVAPEMLDALKSVREFLSSVDGLSINNMRNLACEELAAVNTAIEKATGA